MRNRLRIFAFFVVCAIVGTLVGSGIGAAVAPPAEGDISVANARITTNADTTIVAALGAGNAIQVLWMTVHVEVAGTSSLLRIEDGVGGNILATLDTGDDNNRLSIVYPVFGDAGAFGYELTENTVLNAETTGTGAATIVVNVGYREGS